MSLITSRLSLVHRCRTERNANLDTDDSWGNPLPPDWEPNLADVPCRAWVAAHETVTSKAMLAVVQEIHMVVPLGTDIVGTDRVDEITFRGETYIGGPLDVHAVLRRRDYLEVVLAKAT